MNKYEEYTENIRKALNNTPVKGRDMANLRESCIALFEKLQKERDAHNSIIKEVNQSDMYSQSYKQKLIAEAEEKFADTRKDIISEYNALIQSVLEKKRININKMCATPPSQEQLNLLTSLQIRSKHLTEDEVLRIAPQLATNYNAIKALQVVAEDSHIHIALPEQLNYESLLHSIEWAESYLSARGLDLDTEWSKMNPLGRMFFGKEWNDGVYSKNAVEMLDDNAQLNIPLPTVTPERVITKEESKTLDSLFEFYDEASLKEKIVTAAKSEELRTLINLHPVYRNYLDEGEETTIEDRANTEE